MAFLELCLTPSSKTPRLLAQEKRNAIVESIHLLWCSLNGDPMVLLFKRKKKKKKTKRERRIHKNLMISRRSVLFHTASPQFQTNKFSPTSLFSRPVPPAVGRSCEISI